jgi:hypothetical protein
LFDQGGYSDRLLVVYVLIEIFKRSYKNSRYFKLFFPAFVRRYNKKIRISISYLFRINVDNKYLLIKGTRINQYQPVGGVYKHLDSSSDYISSLGLTPDHDNFGYEEKVRNDLRKFTLGKHIFSVIRWFNKGQDRELSPWREFHEELIKSGILPPDVFPYIFYRRIRQHVTPLRYSPYFKCFEVLIADIYELLPTDGQTQALKCLSTARNDEKYVWVDRDTIEREGHDIKLGTTPFKIAESAKWTIQE